MKNYTLILLLTITLIGCRGGVPKSPDPASHHFSDDLEYNESSSSSSINIRFVYRQPINGYKVTIDWQPFDTKFETGTVAINFRNINSRKEFSYVNFEKYSNYEIYNIVFAEEYKGHYRDTTYYLNYDYELENASTPIYHKAPFQFLDIDFDGEDELLINNWDLLQGGNTYNIYDIIEHENTYSLSRKITPPFAGIQDSSMIDFTNQTITITLRDGYADRAKVVFSKKAQRKAFNFPDSLRQTSGGAVVEYYNKYYRLSELSLDSVYQHLNGKDMVFP